MESFCLIGKGGFKMVFLLLGSSLSSESSFNNKVEFRRNSWNLMESRPVTIEVGFLLESVS